MNDMRKLMEAIKPLFEGIQQEGKFDSKDDLQWAIKHSLQINFNPGYVGVSWKSSNGQEQYEERNLEQVGSLGDLIDFAKSEDGYWMKNYNINEEHPELNVYGEPWDPENVIPCDQCGTDIDFNLDDNAECPNPKCDGEHPMSWTR